MYVNVLEEFTIKTKTIYIKTVSILSNPELAGMGQEAALAMAAEISWKNYEWWCSN